MAEDNSIIIKNIYYMFAYAYQNMLHKSYEKIATERFDHIEDLFASILAKGISQLLKKGFYDTYVTQTAELSAVRGKIDMNNSIRLKLRRRNQLACEFDEFSEDNYLNRILKSTIFRLLKAENVKSDTKAALKKALFYLGNVQLIDISSIRWNQVRFNRSNQTYRMLIHVCYLLIDKLLLSSDSGNTKFANFLDQQSMDRLYEKFILEYYRKHHPDLRPAASKISWNVDDGYTEFLPEMKTDITVRKGDKILIIDAKYYSKTMKSSIFGDKKKFHSSNLYQIFSYVKNKDKYKTGRVSGMLLYAKTDEDIAPSNSYYIDRSNIMVNTLDLNYDFVSIAQQLDDIVICHFGIID